MADLIPDNNIYRQYIVVDRKLKMTRGKMMAQAAHAAMAFLTGMIRDGNPVAVGDKYHVELDIDKDLFEEWLSECFGKIVLAVDGKDEFNAVIEAAKRQGFVEGKDYFVIRDRCYTELTPENDDGTCSTCIGFRPMDRKVIEPVVGNLPLFR